MLKPFKRASLAFELCQEIGGEGKNSRVFIAHDKQLDAQIVIKQIDKKQISELEEYFKEASILYLTSHPNVVPILYACEDDDCVYLAMPYYERGSLNKLMNERFLTVREIIRFAAHFLSGLHNIHSKKLLHVDLKPDNILISNGGEALVSDFGLAKHITANGNAKLSWFYTKMCPPEIFDTEEHSYAFDIYQVGATLYRMCIGNAEFNRQFSRYLPNDEVGFETDLKAGKFPDRSIFPEHIPQALVAVVKKCLEPNPNKRYKAIMHITNALARIDDNWLDWQYNCTAERRVWRKPNNGLTIQLEINAQGKSKAVKINGDGNERKINEFCLDLMNRQKVQSFLRSY